MSKSEFLKKILAIGLAATALFPAVNASKRCYESEPPRKVFKVDNFSTLSKVVSLYGQKSIRNYVESFPNDNVFMNYLFRVLGRKEVFNEEYFRESLNMVCGTVRKCKSSAPNCVVKSGGEISVADVIAKNGYLFSGDSFILSFDSDFICYLKNFERIISPDGRKYELTVVEYPLNKKVFVRQKIEELFMCLDGDLNSDIMKFDGEHGSLFDYYPQRCVNLVYSVK